MNDNHSEARQDLEHTGLRVTAARLAVLDAVRTHPHGSVEELAGRVRERLGTVSIQAVYDILAVLEDNGLARKIEPAGHVSRYEGRVGDNHHHVICRRCGAIADVDCAVGAMPCLQPSATSGFRIDEAEVTFWGLCPRCASEDERETTETNG